MSVTSRNYSEQRATAAPDTLPGREGPAAGTEPIAVVGMACKFPGASDIGSLWQLLERGGNAVVEGVPGSGIGRIGQFYPASANRVEACRYAALVDDIDLFDADFFRISPVEAQLLDPQQRMVLETCWQAVEDAGIDADRLSGSRTGVFIGASNNDYRGVILSSSGPNLEPADSLYTVSGTSFNTVAGRVSYALGLEGPSLIVDTACSSSLVAVHMAMSVLRQGEADLALVGGVQAIFSGRLTELRAVAGMLSSDGQCKAFDASANGFVRGEGCGIAVLKRLRDAEADGDPIWGVIRGSAINQDGASAGLTVPSTGAQVRVIQEALLQADVAPSGVDYLEAHGTGTLVGDPIELSAAAEAYGEGREADCPLLVGSIKTNVGHLEPTAGIAGLMKVLLSMKHGIIPKHLHFRDPNPRVDWTNLAVQIASEQMKWPAQAGRPMRAGVSSYGWSGTNAHLIVESYGTSEEDRVAVRGMLRPTGAVVRPSAPLVELGDTDPAATPALAKRPLRMLPLSGKTEAALRDLAKSYLATLGELRDNAGDAPVANSLLADMAWSAGVGRSHFDSRAGVVFWDMESLRERLSHVADSEELYPVPTASKVAFAYTGQASQWVGMGEDLYRSEPAAREVMDRCDLLIREERGASLLDVMFGRPGAAGDLDDPAWTQPAIYTLECALTALWASIGIRPSAVVGHSLGEIAAAQAAGVFSLETGLKFASARGRLMGALPRAGAMAAVFAPASRLAPKVTQWHESQGSSDLCIGVDNGTQQVISGPAEEVDEFCRLLESEEFNVLRLRPSPAYHSPLVEPALDDLEAVFDGVDVADPSISLISNVTGKPVDRETVMDGSYWRRQARQPVAFLGCVESLADLGVDAVIELGPHSILGPLVSFNWPDGAGNPQAPLVMPSLLRPASDGLEPERAEAFVRAVARAYEVGLPLDFSALFAGETTRRVPLPTYPFQRRRHWVPSSRRARSADAHPLLGARHESPRGEVMFETEMLPTDPAWLDDHRVYGRVVMPGAVYGAMAASVSLAGGASSTAIGDLRLHSALVFPEDSGDESTGKRLQIVVDGGRGAQSRHFEVYSRDSTPDSTDETWTLHAEGEIEPAPGRPARGERVDLAQLKASLQKQDVAAYYRDKAGSGVAFGPSLRTVTGLWCQGAEAVGEIALQETGDSGMEVHPLLLDGCFQVLSATRMLSGAGGDETYLPFGWERLWLHGPLQDRVVCRAQLRPSGDGASTEDGPVEVAETLTGDLWLYTTDGEPLGGLFGFTLKRATRATLLSAAEGLQDLLYEPVWRDAPLSTALLSAEELPAPSRTAAEVDTFAEFLAVEGVDVYARASLLEDLERLSRSLALRGLELLGWERTAGDFVDVESLMDRFGVLPAHSRLVARMLGLLCDAGILERSGGQGYRVVIGAGQLLPDEALDDAEAFADHIAGRHPHGESEIGLLRRSGAALSDVLLGHTDPLSILFRTDGPNLADFYFSAPASRASNRLLAEAVASMVAEWPEDRRLRVIEVGAGTGSGTSVVLPELPKGNFDYVYTDISAGFFATAEDRFRESGASMVYRPLDIERDPASQSYDLHSYDLLIAVNVLHATRDLGETLSHCRDLLAPSGQLIALESLRGRGWQDMTFGQLDGWWRFSDSYRTDHATASPQVWVQALTDFGMEDATVLGGDRGSVEPPLGSGVIIARGPRNIVQSPGVWLLATDEGAVAEEIAAALVGQNQVAVLAGANISGDDPFPQEGILRVSLNPESREDWVSLIEELPKDIPLTGVVHLVSLDGNGTEATTGELARDTRKAGATALAMVQGLLDSGISPDLGTWFITRGAQVLEREYMRPSAGELAGASLWGFGKAVAREAGYLQPRMIDLDPGIGVPVAELTGELMRPDQESHVAYRDGTRRAARLVRIGAGRVRQSLPDDSNWRMAPDPSGDLSGIHAEAMQSRPLEEGEVRVAVEAVGLNFSDVLTGMGAVRLASSELPVLGDEFCGRILEAGPEVDDFCPGDLVLGLGTGSFQKELATPAEMVAHAPGGLTVPELATIPTSFVSAELSFDFTGLNPNDRVLIHTASGGVGLAAVQLVQAAGAEVFATASAPKQDYLRSLGIRHVFDSRSTDFGTAIMEATGGQGVTVVLNSLTGPGFIEASLSCLAPNGRFMEMSRRDIWTQEEMAAYRPDVTYAILEVDGLKVHDPATLGASLKRVISRVSSGELQPLVHTRWPMTEIGAAMEFMRSARHVGKNVIAMPPMSSGRLRTDGTYLVTGGLGGIGCAVADWLVERGAGTIVLNGRRPPDPEAEQAIEGLRQQGANIVVELADVTSQEALDNMLERMEKHLPPLAGIIHSVGVLSDGALGNQNWDRFEQVLWPKILGAWHLHRATLHRDLDMFVLFSSVTGVLGNSGQGNHAAANAFLDQLAAYRRSLGLRGQSIAWGAWSGLGEAEEQRERIERQLAASGTGWISPQLGIRALDQLVAQDVNASMVAAVDWPVFAENLYDRPPFLEELLGENADSQGDDAGQSAAVDLVSQIHESPAMERPGVAAAFLQRELQAVLRLPSAPSLQVGFFDLGMDSLMSVELRNRLNRALAGELVLSNSAIFDYPNLSSLAEHIVDGLARSNGASIAEPRELPEPTVQRKATSLDDSIAIVGMACKFPGAPDLSAYWEILESGRETITDGRQSPGSWAGLTGDPAAKDPALRRGGFIENIDQFDARFFGIQPMSARSMDPQQRMLLETAWQALEDADIDPASLRGSRTGVYLGIGGSEYREVIISSGNEDSFFGTTSSVAAGRVAFALGLEGPAMPIDMACASSLAAVHQAVAALERGEVDLALAAGVNAQFSLPIVRFHREVGMLSESGRCSAFDASADGFVRGEGCGVLVLKRAGEAEGDGDRIWGLVRGTALNQNGVSAAIQTPNGPAQERVLQDALDRAGVAPSEVDYLEAHGSGTLLGDSIELRAIASVYGRGRATEQPLLVGSVKANIGHLEWASGMASIIKAVLAMNHQMIPANLNFSNPNPDFEWDRMPLRIPSESTDWPMHRDRPPLAAINSFGLSGTNAHMIIEGYGTPVGDTNGRVSPAVLSGAPQLVAVEGGAPGAALAAAVVGSAERRVRMLPLSGKTPSALRDLALGYLSWLDERSELLNTNDDDAWTTLSDMAWSAGAGRSHFDRRSGLSFHDAAELRGKLTSLASTEMAEGHTPLPASIRTAFLYTAREAQWIGLGRELYDAEPLFRAVLDRCDEVVRRERGVSLIDWMFGDEGSNGDVLSGASTYAFQAGLTALWNSAGVSPSVVYGRGVGEVAAAFAAGVVSLEDGLRLLLSLSSGTPSVRDIPTGAPSVTWYSYGTGRVVQASDDLDKAFWLRVTSHPGRNWDPESTLKELAVDFVVELGPFPSPDSSGNGTSPTGPSILTKAGSMESRPWHPEDAGAAGEQVQFMRSIAEAYSAGLRLSFQGLFSGERRSRISIPGYPFQRRSFWVRERREG